MKTRLRFVLALLSLLSLAIANAADKPTRPNIVIILADDLGYGDLSCFGQTKWKTPNIDQMAAEGTKLTDFYSACAVCAPSRTDLLTGRYQFRSGMTKNPAPDEARDSDKRGIPSDELLLGEVLQKNGYRTCAVGKWHLGHQPEFNPTKHGFNEYLGILYSHDMRPVQVVDGTKVVEYPVVLANLMRKYTTRATQFMEKNKDKPFFLYFASPLPHKPLFASEEHYKKSGGGLYGDAMMELDWSVGQIFKKLKELGLDDNTLVFFTSDNGPWYGGRTGGLRGMKGLTWDGGIRVPFIARWPGKIPAGGVSHEPAIMCDIFSTSLFAAGIEVPQDRYIDGKNILPLLTSNTKPSERPLFSMMNEELRTIRLGKWKLHLAGSGKSGRGKAMSPNEKWVDKRAPDGVTILAPFEQSHPSEYPGLLTGDETKAGTLFDLESDPAEQHDVSSQNSEVVKRLQAMASEMQKQVDEALAKRKQAVK